MKTYEVHPAAELFPMMSEDQYQELKEDIRQNGCKESIAFWNNQLIDGRNRLKACQELGIQVQECELDLDEDPWSFVISHNLHRRHLTTSQRAVVAGKIAGLSRGENQHTQNCVPSIETAAKSLNVSDRTVNQAKQVLSNGSPELIEAVEQGEVSVNKAATIAKTTPKEEQITEAKKPRKSALGNPYKPPKNKPDSEPKEFSILAMRKEVLRMIENAPEESRHHVGLMLIEIGEGME